MYTAFATFILLLIVIFSVLLFFKLKKDKKSIYDNGDCPTCGATTKSFKDEVHNTTFQVNPIKTRVLKKHGCSGVVEIEYFCTNCGVKEVHSSIGQSCG